MAKQIIVEGQTATNPTTGQRIVFRKGKWYPVDQDPGGNRPANATIDPLTPGAEARTRLALGLGPSINAQRQMFSSEGWEHGSPKLGKNPLNSGMPAVAAALEAIPWDGGAVARIAGGQKYQDYTQAAKTFESAFLPILSGAAVTPTEAQRMIRANLPQVGDTPRTLATKAKNRAMMINGAADLLGRPRPFPKVGIMDLGGKPAAAPSEGQGGGWKVLAVE